MAGDSVEIDRVHRYDTGHHHHSVETCPDCGGSTEECEVEIVHLGIAEHRSDYLVRPARVCSCYQPGRLERVLRWLPWR